MPWPAAAHACLSITFAGFLTTSLLRPRRSRPRPTAPDDTSRTCLPSSFSSLMASTSAPMRARASVPSELDTTAVPTCNHLMLEPRTTTPTPANTSAS
jgi:hypothetical protein